MDTKRKQMLVSTQLDDFVRELAQEYGTTESQIYCFCTALVMQDIEAAGLLPRLTHSTSNRYKYNIDYQDLIAQLLEKKSQA